MAEKFKIKRGDRVVVLAGRDKGKKGEVMRVLRQDRRAVVSGVNMIKRHTRPIPPAPPQRFPGNLRRETRYRSLGGF